MAVPASRILARRSRPILEEHKLYNKAQSRSFGNDTHPAPPSSLNFQSISPGLQGADRQANRETRIAVLGGGITGLASAHYLARELPHTKITVYEGNNRLGGWLRTEQMGETEEGKVFFEGGPRTLRTGSVNSPAGWTTLELIQDLGLADELLITNRNAVAAQNRYIYYPDHLVRMPGPGQGPFSMLWQLFSEPIFDGVAPGIIREWSRPQRPSDLEDESVGDFSARRFGTTNLGDNITSAVLHGIYAGDVYQLSVKSLLPNLWNLEASHGSILKGMWTLFRRGAILPVLQQNLELAREMSDPKRITPALLNKLRSASVYTFKNGISTLSTAIVDELKANPHVELKTNTKIESIEHDGASNQITIQTSASETPSTYTRAISTISGRTLSTLTDSSLPSLAATHSVTVMVVNLFFSQPNLFSTRGFGYLIPRSVAFDQNPERALGVIFDSDASAGQDTLPGTKVTVMLGGHWWDSFDSYPDEEEGIAMAKAVVRRHLKLDKEPEVLFSAASLQRECIPQYTVGHAARMKKANGELRNAFGGKLAVAGNNYAGVGVNDCVRSARDVVMGIKDGADITGLESFERPPVWREISRNHSR